MKRFGTVLVAALISSSGLLPTAPADAARDRVPPKVRFATEDGAVVVSGSAGVDAASVHGTARDKKSGTKRVVVLYCPGHKANGGWTCRSDATSPQPIVERKASLDCSNARRRCTWTAGAPDVPGTYLAIARARDRAGNRSSTGPIEITVV